MKAPENSSSTNGKSRRFWLRAESAPAHIIILFLSCYFIFFFGIGARDLWNPDEPRYAQVGREMMETGEWIVPHLNGGVYTEKPPMYFWLVALASMPFGDVSAATARFPSAASALFVVLLTYILGTKLLGKREAFVGAAVMATSAQFFWIGRVGALDILLALSILAAISVFFVAYADKRPLLYAPGFILLIPGVLSKGPVGVILPLVVMFAFLLTDVFLGKEGARRG